MVYWAPMGMAFTSAATSRVILASLSIIQQANIRAMEMVLIEVHVNTLEEFWILLRCWLRSSRDILQEKLPRYRGIFEIVQNVRRGVKTLFCALLALLVAP